MRHFKTLTRGFAAAALFVLLGACAAVPFDYPKTTSSAPPPDSDTRLAQIAREWHGNSGDKSGFVGLGYGAEALGARLRMMELAENTIDAQYFIIKKDRAGALFVAKMLRAADRGVRVRLLIDDIFSPGVDQPLALLSSHPNIEVRLFNPLSRQGLKALSFLVDFKRANRRMHNKSFTVDNTMSIVGGRNIGEEYFELNEGAKFDDYEVLAIGPVVPEVSKGFDAFWNSELSVPMEAFDIAVSPDELDDWREWASTQLDTQDEGIYATAVNSQLMIDLAERRTEPVLAEATLITDSPEKLLAATSDVSVATLASEIGRRFRAAEKEIIIITPYFIPRQKGAELLEELLDRGIRIVIVTNSLASTNHVPVHSRYRDYRKRLLEAGAEIREVRASEVGGENDWGYQPDRVTLHSKATVVDRRTIFVGSLNFDPRSIVINTEMGLFIESDDIGERFARLVMESVEQVSYRVELDDRGKLRWVYDQGGEREVTDREPEASWGRRAMVNLYRLLPIEGQL